jgi:rhomboid protease GluP
MNQPLAPRPLQPAPRSQPRYLTLPTVKPRLVYFFFAVNIIIFLLQSLTGTDQWLNFGAKVNAAIVAGEWWRLITPMFLHVNILHIAINSYSLYIFGPQVEVLFGYRRFLVVYLLSGVAGTVLSFALSPNPSVGASGAIFGLVGAMLVYFYRHRKLFGEMGRRRLVDIISIAAINLIFGFSVSGIDNWGHVGGLAGGAVLAWLLGPVYTVQIDSATQETQVVDASPLNGQRWLAVLAVGLGLVALTLLAANAQR